MRAAFWQHGCGHCQQLSVSRILHEPPVPAVGDVDGRLAGFGAVDPQAVRLVQLPILRVSATAPALQPASFLIVPVNQVFAVAVRHVNIAVRRDGGGGERAGNVRLGCRDADGARPLYASDGRRADRHLGLAPKRSKIEIKGLRRWLDHRRNPFSFRHPAASARGRTSDPSAA